MGLTGFFVVTGDASNGYLGTAPKHSEARADEVREQLLLFPITGRVSTNLQFYPQNQAFVVGAYEKATFISDPTLLRECCHDRSPEFLRRCFDLCSDGKLLLAGFQSATGFVFYSYYEKRTLVRELCADDDRGLLWEKLCLTKIIDRAWYPFDVDTWTINRLTVR